MQHKPQQRNRSNPIRNILSIVTLSIITLLSGCSTITKDGPPPYDVDVSNIPNATPKVEKLSKYGNMPVYRVNGRNYYVMNSSKHYQAEGVASWYGTKFHKHNTSSGEKYDMLSMTAAHRTLPLPTYLEVTNEANGKTVIVKVNDRGPFADDRLLDLSYAAAKKLGMIGHGTAHVKVKAIDPTEHNNEEIHTNSFYIVRNKNQSSVQPDQSNPPITPILAEQTHQAFKTKQLQYAKNKTYHAQPQHLAAQKSAHGKSHVYLQVGAFSNKTRAEKLKKQITPMIASSVQITQHGHPKTLYRVQIGPIKDNVTMAKINKQLKSIGLNGKVMPA
jgi:rare lipoprotein A